MNPMTDMFDFSKSFEQFSKFQPDFANATPLKAFTDMAAKYRAVTIEAMNKNVELTTAWMQDAAKDAATLMTSEAQPTAYAKKAGEVAQAAMQEFPSVMPPIRAKRRFQPRSAPPGWPLHRLHRPAEARHTAAILPPTGRQDRARWQALHQ